MENNNYETDSKSEIIIIDDAQRPIIITENLQKPKVKKLKKKVTETIEPEIIIIDDQEPTITEENYKKPKTKKHKRKVKLGKDYKNGTEALYITQKLKVRKTKFSCVININNIGKIKKRQPNSIIRPARNECKREAYYNRIVPICMRNNCFADNFSAMNYCRTASNKYFYSSPRESKFRFSELEHKHKSNSRSKHMNRYKEEYRIKKADLLFPRTKNLGLSPVSSSPLAYSDPVSYEDVSDNSFSSEVELDTLIKRTKEREHQFIFPMKAYSEPFHGTPITNEDVASTSGASLHSTSTMVLPPLETEALSPTSCSPSYMCNVSVPYSPTYTPDLISIGNMSDAIDRPYSPSDPTNTLIINEDEVNEDCELRTVTSGPYSLPIPSNVKIEVDHENKDSIRHIVDCMQNGRDAKTETNGTNHMIKIEDIKREEESVSVDYLNNGQIFETEMNVNNNIAIKGEKIKRENANDCEEKSVSEDYLNNGQIFETEMNINNNIAIKSEKIKRENGNNCKKESVSEDYLNNGQNFETEIKIKNAADCDINDNFKLFVKVEKP